MRLLQINSCANYGSTGRIAEQLGQIVISRGGDSFVAYGRKYNLSQSKLYKIGRKLDQLIHGLGTRFFDNHGLYSKSSTRNLIKFIDAIKPDIIHLHNLHGYYLNYVILFDYLKTIKVPIIWTLHDCWAFTGHCTYFDNVSCNKWNEVCFSCPQKREYPSSFFMDSSRENFYTKIKSFTEIDNLHLVTPSNWLYTLLSKSFLRNVSKSIIPNGIDINTFNLRTDSKYLKSYFGKFLILGVSSGWHSRKGLNDFLTLASYLDENELIVLVGLNKNQLKNLPRNVIGIEHTDNVDELAEIYSFCDVFVNPTYEDNFPTTNIEALSCGTPVITYNTGGSPEIINELTGYVVEKGDINGILLAKNEIKNIGKESFKMPCRERAITLFNMKNNFQKYFDLYQRVIVQSSK